MAQIKKDTSLRKAILQAAITGQLISDIGGESDVLFSNEKKSKTKLDSEADLPLASRVSKRNSVVSDSERTTPSAGTPSNAPTETGKELLDRIIEERNNKLLTEWEEKQTDLFASNDAHSKNAKTVRSEQIRLLKKAKKPSPIVASEIDEDEIPFEIPENWCWCRLGDICIAQLGKTLDKVKNKGDEVPYLCSINVNWGKIDLEKVKSLKLEESEKQKYLLEKGDLLICEGGDVGRSAIWNLDEIMYYQNALHRVRFFLNLNQKYFYYVLFQYKNLGFLDAVSKGMTIKHLVQGALLNLAIPLPPLAAQNAIVAKLEQVLPLVDAYENAVLQKEELKNALPDKIKKAILQEAITGKLTEQWRKQKAVVEPVETTESGEQLLDRIIKERNAKALAEWEEKVKTNPKAKKPVPVVASEIGEEEIPFEVPESWCWCRWGELSELIQYGYNAPAKESGRIKMVRITDIQNGKVQWNTVPFCEISDTDIQVYQLRKNDILFARTGGTVGKSFLVDEEPENAVFAGYLIRTQYDDKKLNPKYMKMFMESQIYWDQLKNGTIATAQPNCNGQTLSKMILPLPPLTEQQEIVKKVEELLELCK